MSVHTFDPAVAAQHGVIEAVLIKNFQFWILHNKRNNRNHFEGRTWTYNSAKALSQAFPYLSAKQIYGAICRLCEAGVMIKGNFNDHKYDRTSWYSFTDESVWITPEEDLHFPPRENGKPRAGEPIPDTLPDSYSDKNPPGTSALPRGGEVKEEKKPEPKPAPKKKADEKRPAREYWQAFVDTWHDFTAGKLNGETPSIVGRHLNELAKLYDLLQLRAKKKQQVWTQEYMVKALTFYLGIAWAEDWLRAHWLLKNLVEQFDAVFGREAQKKVASKKPPDLQYIVDRYFEGQLDDRILTPEIYKQLVTLKLVPEDHWGNFVHPKVPNATAGDATTAAIKDWLRQQKNPNK
jgi:hypothetical protein